MPDWDPGCYLRFADPRQRPALDLIARIPPADAGVIWDLGCGTGNVTRLLAERWPDADVHGLDSSADMLAAAREIDGITWQEGDIAEWEPASPVDILFSNAAYHWVDDHDTLFPRLLHTVRPGGVFATQMPRNTAEPSHQILYQTARSEPWAARVGHLAGWKPVDEPSAYYDRLAGEATAIEIWETIYVHVLSGDDPVARWTRGTSARRFLDVLSADEAKDFVADYAGRLRAAYPARPDGTTLFPFRRLFILATR